MTFSKKENDAYLLYLFTKTERADVKEHVRNVKQQEISVLNFFFNLTENILAYTAYYETLFQF